MNSDRRSVFSVLAHDIHSGSCKLSEELIWTKVHSTLWFKGAASHRLVPALVRRPQPPTSLPPAPHLLNSLLHHLPSDSTHTHLLYALPLYSLKLPPSLSAHFGIVIKHDSKRHIFVSCQKLFPCYTFVYLFNHLKKT